MTAFSRDDETRQRMFFRLAAPLYDLTVGPTLKAHVERAVEMVSVQRGDNALDVGTGTGIMAYALADAGASVTGIDISSAMLARAEKKRNNGSPVFQKADATDLPFAGDSFAIGAISMVLHELSPRDADKALQELRRVVTREILVLDYVRRPDCLPLAWTLAWLERLEGADYSSFIDNDLSVTLKDAGLTITQQDRQSFIGMFVCQP